MAARVTQELVNMRGQLQGKEEELLKHKQEGRATNLINYTLYPRSVFSLAHWRTVNFGNQCNLQISSLSASRLLTYL